ncbi:hypothetical protein EPO17_02770 [Patescibacteria group bacterium]|nr:MAG: hypothetical protein EPO17_02770 [Patescibacteria group bacterium]
MTTKESTRFSKSFLEMQGGRENPLTKMELISNALAVDAYVLTLAKTGKAPRRMLLVPQFNKESVTLWSPKSQIVWSEHCPAIGLLMDAENLASRVRVEVDTKHNETMVVVRMLFLPSGKDGAPLLGVFAMVASFGVRILRLMNSKELEKYLPKPS